MPVLAVVLGTICTAVLARVPVAGPLIGGFLAGIMSRDAARGMLAGFSSGILVSLILGLVLVGVDTPITGLLVSPEVATTRRLVGTVLGVAFFIPTLYFGVLGLLGGTLGGIIGRERRPDPTESAQR